MYVIGLDDEVQRFRLMHSEIIEFFQCIEFDMKRIYSGMSADSFDDCMEYLDGNNWGVIMYKLKKLDNSDNDPFFTEEEYELLDEIREKRNFWCHQCYLEFVYIQDGLERYNRLQKLNRQLENEKNRVSKLHHKMQDIYFEYFYE